MNNSLESLVPLSPTPPLPPENLNRSKDMNQPHRLLSSVPVLCSCFFLLLQWRLLKSQMIFLFSAPSETEKCGHPLCSSVCADVHQKQTSVHVFTVTFTERREDSICGSRFYMRKQTCYFEWYFTMSTHKLVAKARPCYSTQKLINIHKKF